MTINGTTYSYDQGRVLLVSTAGDKATVTQVVVPLSDADYLAELDRIEQLDEVQEFVTGSGGGKWGSRRTVKGILAFH